MSTLAMRWATGGVGVWVAKGGIVSAKSAGLACVGITTTYSRSHLMDADRIVESLDEFTPDLIESLNVEPG